MSRLISSAVQVLNNESLPYMLCMYYVTIHLPTLICGYSLTIFILYKRYDVSCSLCTNKITTMANVIIPHEQSLYSPCFLSKSPNISKTSITSKFRTCSAGVCAYIHSHADILVIMTQMQWNVVVDKHRMFY